MFDVRSAATWRGHKRGADLIVDARDWVASFCCKVPSGQSSHANHETDWGLAWGNKIVGPSGSAREDGGGGTAWGANGVVRGWRWGRGVWALSPHEGQASVRVHR
eukprot:6902500-Prymnesium_polylepis.1